jgi:hypothetical protein
MLSLNKVVWLNSGGLTNAIARFIKPGYLYTAALLFFILSVILVAVTYYILYVKKKKALFRNNIRQQLEEWITEIALSDSSGDFPIPETFLRLFKQPEARQMMMDELVINKSNFLGNVSGNIIKLYHQLGLNVDSRLKLDHPGTHIQCQGIHELCVMEQKDQVRKVYRLTNSENNDVRIEAQTALLQWYGFKGLRFLNVVTYPITEFQQLKLLELLRILPFEGLPQLNKWLQSKNDTVVSFALKLPQHYKQVQALPVACTCLSHTNEAVRVQAVKTLATIGNASTASLLTESYPNENFTNRLNILKELPKVATDEQRDFLIGQLHEGHEHIKLATAKVLANCTANGMEILEAKSYNEPVPFRDIFLHVKSEALA